MHDKKQCGDPKHQAEKGFDGRTCTRKPMRMDESMSNTCLSCLPMLTCTVQHTGHATPNRMVSGCMQQRAEVTA